MPAAQLTTAERSRRRLLASVYRSGGLLSFAAAARFGVAREAALFDCMRAGLITRSLTGYALTDAGKTEARR